MRLGGEVSGRTGCQRVLLVIWDLLDPLALEDPGLMFHRRVSELALQTGRI